MKRSYATPQIEFINLDDDIVRTSGQVEGADSDIGRFGVDRDDWFFD